MNDSRPLPLSRRGTDTEESKDPPAEEGGAPDTTEELGGDAPAGGHTQRGGDGAEGDGSAQVIFHHVQVCHV